MFVNVDSICKAHFGAHYCLFYRSKNGLVDFLTQYFKQGIDNGEYCMWVTPDIETENMAQKKLSSLAADTGSPIYREKLKFVGTDDWYLRDGHFDTERICQCWEESLNNPDIQCCKGLRATGDLGWYDEKIWQSLMHYEARLNDIIPHNRFIAICTYPIDNLSPIQISEILKRHQLAIAEDKGNWQVFNTFNPGSLPGFLADAYVTFSLKPDTDIIFSRPLIFPEKCDGCGICVDVCERDLLYLDNHSVAIKNDLECNWCGDCETVCPSGAISCPFDIA